MKICGKCKTEKELGEFSKQKSKKDGLQSHCKACEKQYRSENSERIKQYKKQYNEQWRAENAEYSKQWRAENVEHVKQYRAENAEREKQRAKQWRADNPEAKAEHGKAYRAKHPEKIKAKNKANKNLPSIKGMHRHHWSYQEKHWLDVIYVDASLHRYYHSMLEYDSKHMMYRVRSTGQLLDTKQQHSSFLVELSMQKKEVHHCTPL